MTRTARPWLDFVTNAPPMIWERAFRQNVCSKSEVERNPLAHVVRRIERRVSDIQPQADLGCQVDHCGEDNGSVSVVRCWVEKDDAKELEEKDFRLWISSHVDVCRGGGRGDATRRSPSTPDIRATYLNRVWSWACERTGFQLSIRATPLPTACSAETGRLSVSLCNGKSLVVIAGAKKETHRTPRDPVHCLRLGPSAAKLGHP